MANTWVNELCYDSIPNKTYWPHTKTKFYSTTCNQLRSTVKKHLPKPSGNINCPQQSIPLNGQSEIVLMYILGPFLRTLDSNHIICENNIPYSKFTRVAGKSKTAGLHIASLLKDNFVNPYGSPIHVPGGTEAQFVSGFCEPLCALLCTDH